MVGVVRVGWIGNLRRNKYTPLQAHGEGLWMWPLALRENYNNYNIMIYTGIYFNPVFT